LQEKALKCIYEDQNSTYEELLEKSKLPSLKVRRIRTIAITHTGYLIVFTRGR
jgi:hypothetical protein